MRKINHFILALCALCFVVSALNFNNIYAEDNKNEISGKYLVFNSNSNYEFENALASQDTDSNSLGNMMIGGEILDITEKNGVPAFKMSGGGTSLYYIYGDEYLNAEKDEWHLTDDDGKKVDSINLNSKIKKGAIILQTSRDGETWVNEYNETNIFKATPVQTDSFYSANDMQLTNGTYYRVIVAYELAKRKETKKAFILDDWDTKKCAEVYEFYLYNEDSVSDASSLSTNVMHLGETVKKKLDSGYSDDEKITSDDAHYGWNIGDFYIKGYSESVKNNDGSIVFLKNVGDQLELYFTLNQDINKLNDNDKLQIAEDKNGYDLTMQTAKQNFKKGALIIQKTNYENVKEEPIIYTNYLEANTSLNADTKVELFEEGDYEVILDYSIKDSRKEVLSTGLGVNYGDYQIKFSFSVRNGNCMVYPFELGTTQKNELANNSVTSNGFSLDLAKSRYLKINIKRETLSSNGTSLSEDTRFNSLVKDGEEYKDEGIYTITVTNEYTKLTTQKRIYVGDNKKIIAYMKSGLSLEEINKQLNAGATINDEGEIVLPEAEETNKTTSEEVVEIETTKEPEETVGTDNGIEIHSKTENNIKVTTEEKKKSYTWFYIACIVGIVAGLVIYVVNNKNNKGE